MATVIVRLTEDQKKMLTDAAGQVGLGLSGWMRSIAIKEARRVERDGE